jgi:hypothetical protein
MNSPLKYARPLRAETVETWRPSQLISQTLDWPSLSDPGRRMRRARMRRSFQLLAHVSWRRHKGGHSRRSPRRIGPAVYSIVGRPILQNTCCTSLLGAASTTSSSVPTPT